jgi:twitching motility protein PilT
LLDDMLRRLAEADGSDLHVKVGSPARIRVNGSLRRLEDSPDITPQLTAEMAGAIMRDDVAEQFEAKNDADFAYAVPSLGRFRVNAFRQRGTVGLIFRRVLPASTASAFPRSSSASPPSTAASCS